MEKRRLINIGLGLLYENEDYDSVKVIMRKIVICVFI